MVNAIAVIHQPYPLMKIKGLYRELDMTFKGSRANISEIDPRMG